MKKIIILILISGTAFIAKAQDNPENIIPKKDGQYMYEFIVDADSLTKEKLYDATKLWFVNTFNSGKDVIQLDDKENGKIVGRGWFKFNTSFVTATYEYMVYFRIEVTCKDYKYRMRLYDIEPEERSTNSNFASSASWHQVSIEDIIKRSTSGAMKKYNLKNLKTIDETLRLTIISLKRAMQSEVIISKDDFKP